MIPRRRSLTRGVLFSLLFNGLQSLLGCPLTILRDYSWAALGTGEWVSAQLHKCLQLPLSSIPRIMQMNVDLYLYWLANSIFFSLWNLSVETGYLKGPDLTRQSFYHSITTLRSQHNNTTSSLCFLVHRLSLLHFGLLSHIPSRLCKLAFAHSSLPPQKKPATCALSLSPSSRQCKP